jgi:hypothetical protein
MWSFDVKGALNRRDLRWAPQSAQHSGCGSNGQTTSGFDGGATARTDGRDEMSAEVFESVWDALEDTPAEAENMSSVRV